MPNGCEMILVGVVVYRSDWNTWISIAMERFGTREARKKTMQSIKTYVVWKINRVPQHLLGSHLLF